MSRVLQFLLPISLVLALGGTFFSWSRVTPKETAPRDPFTFTLRRVGGPLRHLAATFLWGNAIRDIHESRGLAALDKAELALNLTPESPEAWTFFAYQIAYNISKGENEASRQWRWIEEGIRAAEEGIATVQEPRRIQHLLAMIYFDRIAKDPRFVQRLGSDPWEKALPYLEASFAQDSVISGAQLFSYYSTLGRKEAGDGRWKAAKEAFAKTAAVLRQLAQLGMQEGDPFLIMFQDMTRLMEIYQVVEESPNKKAGLLREGQNIFHTYQDKLPILENLPRLDKED